MLFDVDLSTKNREFFSIFEDELEEFLLKLVKEERFAHLKVKFPLKVTKPTVNDKVFALVSNASPDISCSYDFHTEVSLFLNKRKAELEYHLEGNLIIVQLSLSVQINSNQKNDNSNENDDPSPFIAKDPIFTLDQMVLPEELLTEMKSAINAVKYQKLIYEEWGFIEVDPVPKCVLNFYGPPGTGKTMAAHALAASIGKKIMEANYGDIESKFVGDAPKNMKKVFARAKEADCVLFFDEADSVMGKRMSNATNGAEQAINSLRSETLKHLEQHNGVVIMATNLVTTFDPAFKSRILKSLKFDLPNKEARIDIIKKKTPSKMPIDIPLTDEQYSELSDIAEGMSGREIKNCFIDMAQRKANECGESGVFNFYDFKSAFERQKVMIDKLKKEETREKEEKILNALKPKTSDEAKGRIQSLLEDKTQEERKEIMDYVYLKLDEVDKKRKEATGANECSAMSSSVSRDSTTES